MSQELEFFWKGRLPLSSISWHYDSSKNIEFSDSFNKSCNEFWLELRKEFSNLYDGKLLAIEDIEYSENSIVFHLGNVRFSQITYHYRKKLPLVGSMGSLGFQALVYNPTRTHVLVGQRFHGSEYRPGAFALPGGIFEVQDTDSTIVTACLRELTEEISIQVKPETMKMLAIFRELNHIATGIIIEVESKEEIRGNQDSFLQVDGNEEWEKKVLKWYPIDEVATLDSKNS
ncbi:MAG: NUDIX hydrolase [Asgard group archaeon]|nr:NUDIX hydrolase [Asgard group archaeon]